jgi:hypothetical protein
VGGGGDPDCDAARVAAAAPLKLQAGALAAMKFEPGFIAASGRYYVQGGLTKS